MSDRPPLLRQLTGAGIGALIAVGLYGAYRTAEPTVRAYLLPPGYSGGEVPAPHVRMATSESTDREARLNDRARRVVARLETSSSSRSSRVSSATGMAPVSAVATTSLGTASSVANTTTSPKSMGTIKRLAQSRLAQAHEPDALPSSGFPLGLAAIAAMGMTAGGMHGRVRAALRRVHLG
ncbi:MAG: hypothetical protein G01um101425_194 [Candidatus Peregrinibacteria bacterium Gr01-1014_25]|nr:MAG: hypothetical protein G01um101425_194 [Candidatus Peregrinibacteria bacterium Gr01-1014_25]